MRVKTNCKHFKWKKIELISMNKINQNMLIEPYCNLDKLTKFLSCPEKCEWFEKIKP